MLFPESFTLNQGNSSKFDFFYLTKTTSYGIHIFYLTNTTPHINYICYPTNTTTHRGYICYFTKPLLAASTSCPSRKNTAPPQLETDASSNKNEKKRKPTVKSKLLHKPGKKPRAQEEIFCDCKDNVTDLYKRQLENEEEISIYDAIGYLFIKEMGG